jgi:starch synthase
MKVLSVASEIFPLVKTGGLADVTGALPQALAAEGLEVWSVLPGYPAVLKALDGEMVHHFEDLFGGPSDLLVGKVEELRLFVIDAPHLFSRGGNPYLGPDGLDWPDNAQRFAALSWVAAEIGRGLVPGFVPIVVHAHDWQAGLVSAYLHYGSSKRPGTIITIHNLAFQGVFQPSVMEALRLPLSAFQSGGVEYYGKVGFLKAGLHFSDYITTVSPTYAIEIQMSDAGMGLDGLLRNRKGVLRGILNGIDDKVWNPATDLHLIAPYDAKRLSLRVANKTALKQRLGLTPDPEALLFGVVSRLSHQKGLDLLLESIGTLIEQGIQLALLGSGDPTLEDAFAATAAANPDRVGVRLGYDEGLAHLIQGGVDALLVPSRYEPCGLTQLCALRYGAVPVVTRVGGLADTIIDANEAALASGAATGIQFGPACREMLEAAINRTVEIWHHQPTWRRLQTNGMNTDVGWTRSAQQYVEVYKAIVRDQIMPKTCPS